MKMLMTHPEKYRKAASLGGGVWLAQKYARGQTEGFMDRLLEQDFGTDRDAVCGGKNDCLGLPGGGPDQGRPGAAVLRKEGFFLQ